MEENVAKLNVIESSWAWYQANKKQVLLVAGIAVVVAAIVSYYVWRQGERETRAAEDFSRALASANAGGSPSAAGFLKVATDHSGTTAGARALLQAAMIYFTQGQYPDAQAQFNRFLSEYAESQFRGQALLGVATCLDAQGKLDEAAPAYKRAADARPNESVAWQAKFALARISELQNKIEQARSLYEEVAKANQSTTLGDEAAVRAEELRLKFAAPPAPASAAKTAVTTAAPVSSPSTSNLTTPKTAKP